MTGPWWCPSGYEDRLSMSAEDERRADDEPFEAKLEREDDLIEEDDVWEVAA